MPIDFGFDSDFLKTLLGEFPQAAFDSRRPQRASRRDNTFFDTEFASVQREFEGRSARALREGRLPDETFLDFLDDPNFFQNRRAAASPRARGDFSQQLFAPSVSFSRPLR
jgi:hypothetical protein